MRTRYVSLLAAGAIATMVGAPAALADEPDCSDVSAGTECSSPGNVEINDAPPAVTDDGFGGGAYGGPYPVPFDEGSH